jgi:hypothetical protein
MREETDKFAPWLGFLLLVLYILAQWMTEPWHWLICAVCAMIYAGYWLIAFFVIRQQRLHDNRFQRGLCLHCGYDLRASKERCPECGRPVRPPDEL